MPVSKLSSVNPQVMSCAARAENARSYVVQSEKATAEGVAFLCEQTREALRDVIREAKAALAVLDA